MTTDIVTKWDDKLLGDGNCTIVQERVFARHPATKRKFQVLPVNNHAGYRKVGRNERCRCGSGLKFKKCCGR